MMQPCVYSLSDDYSSRDDDDVDVDGSEVYIQATYLHLHCQLHLTRRTLTRFGV